VVLVKLDLVVGFPLLITFQIWSSSQPSAVDDLCSGNSIRTCRRAFVPHFEDGAGTLTGLTQLKWQI
jgi:hypothetical protein